MGINLSGCHALMPQKFPQALQRGAVIQHSCGEGVTEHMRRPFLQCCHHREVLSYDTLHLVTRHALSLVVEKKSHASYSTHFLITSGYIVAKFQPQFTPKGNDTLFIAFSRHLELT